MSNTKNEALIITKPKKIDLQECPMPEPKKDELLIEVHYVAVCGSDIKLFAGSYTAPHKYPIVIGHEWLGRVIQTCEGTDIKVDDYVVGDCSIFCGECYYCKFNKNHCIHIEKRGITLDGGCARYIAINKKHVTRCIDGLKDPKLLTLTEPMSVAVNGIANRVPRDVLDRTRKALIMGCGGIGLMSLFTLRYLGVKDITMTDIVPEKVQMVNDWGLEGVHALQMMPSEMVEGKKVEEEFTHGPNYGVMVSDHVEAKKIIPVDADGNEFKDSFDLIVEATGQAESCLGVSVSLAAPCAHLVCLGHQKPLQIDFGSILKKSMTIHASNGSTGGFPQAMEIIRDNEELVAQMVTDIVPLKDAAVYFRRKILKKPNIKVLIDLND